MTKPVFPSIVLLRSLLVSALAATAMAQIQPPPPPPGAGAMPLRAARTTSAAGQPLWVAAPTTQQPVNAAPPGQPNQPANATPTSPQDPVATAAAEAAQKKAEQDQKKQERLQKITQVAFDRRPTTILRTWTSPPEKGVVNGETPPAAAAPNAGPVASESKEPTNSIVLGATSSPFVFTGLSSGPATVTGQPIAIAPDGATAPDPLAAEQPTSGGQPPPNGIAPPVPAVDPFDQELVQWARAVTLGEWSKVKAFLASLPTDDEKKAAYTHMLNALGQPPQDPNLKPFFAFTDVLGMCDAAPTKREDAAFLPLGVVLGQVMTRGLLLEPMLEQLGAVSSATGDGAMLSRREVVKLLFGAGQQVASGQFLPSVVDATAAKDFEGLNLLAQHLIAKHDEEGKAVLLEQAWEALQNVFAVDDVEQKQKESALKTAVGLAPRLRKELGQSWLDGSFTKDVQRGMDIIASIGVAAADAAIAQAQNPNFRQLTLQLQQTAIAALLHAAPERAAEWRTQLSILADNWLREATSAYQFDQSSGYYPSMRRDRFGNFFYYDDSTGTNGQTIKVADVLDLRPSPQWVAQLEAGMQPKFAMMTAQLWLKMQEEAQAFPYIQELAKTHPVQAKELVDEFVKVWTRNHDPNAGRSNNYFYGYEQRAEGIPLTRSKQQRNIKDLAHWIAEMKKLPIKGPAEDLLAQAFTTCHSSAEVYRIEAIEQVFGSLGGLKPRTLAALAQQMRANLATVWRLPATQEKAKTRRRQKDIEAEVDRGYQVARAVLDGGLAQHEGDWSLLLARATLQHDEIDYRREIGNEVAFTEKRLAAFADFSAAADNYAKVVADLPKEEESTEVYEHWFYAALGSSDLQNISHEHVHVQSQIDAVRDRIKALPGDASERHMSRFANLLFTRMSSLNPAVKLRYVKAGLDVVGDHKQAFEAKKLYDYYKDITSEIELTARVDGPTEVGHGQPFGLFVEIRHTRDIERESGGFGRYLRNQNDISNSYNYGRPTENYRDKFAEMAKQMLSEHFDVLSVTFQNDSVHSRATEQYGWRVTPYAYLMLKPRGPQVDRIPQLRLDLDFLDTSGYAVLPIESTVLAIDATPAEGPTRPSDKLEITQILDERQAAQGKLVLEIKATSHGLPAKLADLVDVAPSDFDVSNVDDSGPMVTRFDPDGATDTILAERTFTLSLTAKPNLPARPTKFSFPTAKREGTTMLRQRYADADLVAAEPVVDLLEQYGAPRSNWPSYAGGAAALLLLIGLGFAMRRRPAAAVIAGLEVPEHVTPFTVLGLLRQIQSSGELDAATVQELAAAMQRIEAGYFATQTQDSVDLHALAHDWVARARRRSAS